MTKGTGLAVGTDFHKRFLKHKKTHVEPSMLGSKEGEPAPGTLTGDKVTMSSAYGWRGVEQVELDRILAAGPTVDPLITRGLPNFVQEFS